MPHIDELFGISTIAASGLFVAIALQPQPDATVQDVAGIAASPAPTAIVQLPPVNVVAQRSVELARLERDRKAARERPTRLAAPPGV